MTSYHDLEEQTYRSVIAEHITRIHGKPVWRTKEVMKNELTKIAIKHKVSYDWSGDKGLIALIIGAERLKEDYPDLPDFTMPERPPSAAVVAAGTSQHATREARDKNDLLKRDYAVVRGFCRAAAELIRRALDSEYFKDLEHVVYG